MELLKEFIRVPGLPGQGRTLLREAARGIIVNGRDLLMIHSRRNGDYKFPGGSFNPDETPEQALVREVREECGAHVSRIDEALRRNRLVLQRGDPSVPRWVERETFVLQALKVSLG